MDNSLSSGLILLLAGMGTVLAMLWGIVLLGQLLIRAVNRFLPLPLPPAPSGGVSPAVVAVISAAVEAATQGQGRPASIRKA